MIREFVWALSLALIFLLADGTILPQWSAKDLQNAVNSATTPGTTIYVPPGDYYFHESNLNITHARNISIIPATAGNITLWFSGDAGINISHSTNVQIGHAHRGSVVIDYDPPPPQHPTFHEKSGITLHMHNCTRVLVENVSIRAAPFMAVTAFQGGGDHVFRQLRLELAANRTLVGVRDALHFSDLRKGPTVVDSTIGYTGDDFFNVHTTLMLVLRCQGLAPKEHLLECLIVNPRVMVNASQDTVYGTFSSLKFVEAQRDILSFYHWPSTDMALEPWMKGAIVQSIVDVSSSYGRLAQQTLPPLLMFPPSMGWIEATNQTTKFSAEEVWQVVLKTPKQFSDLPQVGSIVTIDTIASTGAKLINNIFLYSHCNIGRFKSPGGVLQGNVFRQARIPNLEISALPQWFEGPVDVRDILVADNLIEGEGNGSPIHCGPLCEKPECHPGKCNACPLCGEDTFWARNVTLCNNTIRFDAAALAEAEAL
jgi:hypothetical protein